MDRANTTTSAGTRPDFRALLKKQPTAPPTSLPAITPPPTATPTGTIGTVTLGTPGPVFNPVPTTVAMAPAAQSLFGPNPWIANAGGTGPNGGYSYNKYYFATPETAAKVAQMVGGRVVATNDITPFGPFVQNQANQMVQMPDGRLINAGIIASYYDRGWSQQTVDSLVNCETGLNSTFPT